jgi:hypothetical protein
VPAPALLLEAIPEVGPGVVPDHQLVDGEHAGAGVVAADDVGEAAIFARETLVACRRAPIVQLRRRDDRSVHVEANRVRGARDAAAIPDTGHMDPLAVVRRDRGALAAIHKRERRNNVRVHERLGFLAEEDRELEPRIAGVNVVLDVQVDLVDADEVIRAAEDAMRIVLEWHWIAPLLVPGFDGAALGAHDRVPQERGVNAGCRKVRAARDACRASEAAAEYEPPSDVGSAAELCAGEKVEIGAEDAVRDLVDAPEPVPQQEPRRARRSVAFRPSCRTRRDEDAQGQQRHRAESGESSSSIRVFHFLFHFSPPCRVLLLLMRDAMTASSGLQSGR